MTALDVRPVAGALGAEITGVDLRRATDADMAEIRRVWLETVSYTHLTLPTNREV